jgi:hypothetical protein
VSSACRDERDGVAFLSFRAVEMFFSCALYDFTIILCCLLGFRSSLDRASTLASENNRGTRQRVLFKSCTLFLVRYSERQVEMSHNICF